MICFSGDWRSNFDGRDYAWLGQDLVVFELRGSSIPFQLILGTNSHEFVASVIKESGLSVGEATVDVTKENRDTGFW